MQSELAAQPMDADPLTQDTAPPSFSFRAVRRALVVAALPLAVSAQTPTNLSFETHDASGRAAGWSARGEGFQVVVDSAAPFAGRFSLRTRWVDAAPYVPTSMKFAVASQTLPAAPAVGRKLHLTGYIRTENISAGYAGFWMRVDAPGGRTIAFDNMSERGPHGTTPWTRYDIELPVDSSAATIRVGVLHPGDGTAWYDSLTIDVVGDPMPRTAATPTQQARPSEDMTRLLGDAELALSPDSVTVPEDPQIASWIASHAHPIRSLGATDYADLRFFAPLLASKRIVQLGESGHGVAEFSMAKVRVIKYLHEELGYDVMAFESSTYECERAQRSVATLTADALMRGCIFGVWHAAEVLPLFEYIKQTQSTARPLILAGFDEQTSAFTANARPAAFRSLVAPLDSPYAQHVYEADSVFLANRTPAYATANRARLVAFYDSLATFLAANRRMIEAAHRDDANVALVARQAAISMTVFVRQLAATEPAGSEIRDLGMANNLDFLLNELYPARKVIVWAHNFHIQHRENTPNAADATISSLHTMGTWVAARHRPALYTIGLFMYRGTAASNYRQPYMIMPSQSGSLESILHRAPWRYSYVDFSQARRDPGTEWMWKPITALSWGTTPERFVPRDEYDGILFIDTVHPPRYR